MAGFGISVTLVEPGGFSTDWAGPSAKHSAELPAYAAMREAARNRTAGAKRGDPTASAAALLKVVDADEPPLRVFFGTAPLGIARADYESRLQTWERWNDVAELAQG